MDKQRVGVVFCADDKTSTITIIGYGEMVGDAVPMEAVGFMAETLKANNTPNPKIVLDSGQVVYGCEVWWAPEDKIKELVAKYDHVVTMDIDAIRKKYVEDKKNEERKNNGDGVGG